MKQPLVSVGIPTYNRPEGLRKALKCITAQTYSNLEIIVSNNCSPDPLVEIIIKEFTKTDNRIRHFRQNENIGGALNFIFVLEKANGNYFMWAADDDEWGADFIELCMNKHLEDPDLCVVLTKYSVRSKANMLLGSVFSFPDFNYLNNIDPLIRVGKFFNEREVTHKANFIYGVWKTNLISDITKKVFDPNGQFIHGDSGTDVAILCYCFYYHRACQVNKTSYFKYYERGAPGSFIDIKTFASSKWELLKYMLNGFTIKYDVTDYIKNMETIFNMIGIEKKFANKMIENKKKQYLMK